MTKTQARPRRRRRQTRLAYLTPAAGRFLVYGCLYYGIDTVCELIASGWLDRLLPLLVIALLALTLHVLSGEGEKKEAR